MKLLGHAWVAINSIPEGNKNQLILGSITPEIMFYTSKHPFSYEEIHEGGVEVLKFAHKHSPNITDFALGMIAHSKQFGADRFNNDDKLAILGYNGPRIVEIQKDIIKTMNVTPVRSKVLAHNLLELAVELSIIKNHSDFVAQFLDSISDTQTQQDAIKLLSQTFNKPIDSVADNLNELLLKVAKENFRDAYGLSSLWRKLEPKDPEYDINKMSKLLIRMNEGFEGKEWKFLEECTIWTKNNLELHFNYK